jgi:hypothetical protein
MLRKRVMTRASRAVMTGKTRVVGRKCPLPSIAKELKLPAFEPGRADDWVVTCRTRAEAEHALARAVKILEQLGVTLNQAKTRIVHITRGFEFLGFKIQRGKGKFRLAHDRQAAEFMQTWLRTALRRLQRRLKETLVATPIIRGPSASWLRVLPGAGQLIVVVGVGRLAVVVSPFRAASQGDASLVSRRVK